MNHNALERLEDFVFECLLQYSEQGIINDLSQEWHECHNPKPKCLGGNKITQLLIQHHAIHGIYQSEAFDYPCIWGWERKYLVEPEHIELFEKWMREKSRMGGTELIAEKNEQGQSVNAVKAAEESAKKRRKPVLLTDLQTGLTYPFPSVRGAAKELNISTGGLSDVLNGKLKQHKGFTAVFVL